METAVNLRTTLSGMAVVMTKMLEDHLITRDGASAKNLVILSLDFIVPVGTCFTILKSLSVARWCKVNMKITRHLERTLFIVARVVTFTVERSEVANFTTTMIHIQYHSIKFFFIIS